MKTLSNLINFAFKEKGFTIRISHFEDPYSLEKLIEYYFTDSGRLHVSPTLLIRGSDCTVFFKTMTMAAYEENGDYVRRIPLDPFSSDFFEKLMQLILQAPNLRKTVENDIEENK
tara:strand:+ start:9421 stop:9765 length:345 start_codon:yes stop_codon:yes gene_type:complete